MHPDTPTSRSLLWRVACSVCDWMLVIQALVPYGPANQEIGNDDMQVSGFWEDYCCPQHLCSARRRIHLSDAGTSLEDAYISLFSGQILDVESVPNCPQCRQTMHGGQTLEQLPYHIQPALELTEWLLDKSERLQQLVDVETRAVQRKETTADHVHHILLQELQLMQYFRAGMCRQFHINMIAVPFFAETPTDLAEWETHIQSLQQRLMRRRIQLQQRQRNESHKSPSVCPSCHQHNVYLIEAKTI